MRLDHNYCIRCAARLPRRLSCSDVLLLVDDRDGRILAEIQTEEEARLVLEAWSETDGTRPEFLSLLEVHGHRGNYFDTDTSVKVRPASLADWLD